MRIGGKESENATEHIRAHFLLKTTPLRGENCIFTSNTSISLSLRSVNALTEMFSHAKKMLPYNNMFFSCCKNFFSLAQKIFHPYFFNDFIFSFFI